MNVLHISAKARLSSDYYFVLPNNIRDFVLYPGNERADCVIFFSSVWECL